MRPNLIEQIERLALFGDPRPIVKLIGMVPPPATLAIQRARFRRTLRLAAQHSPFYREQFRRRGINVRRISHPSELGDFYTTGEDLREYGAEAFLTGRADTAFETTGTTSSVPKRVFFSHREIDEMGRASAIGLYFLGLRRDDKVLSAFDCSFWVSPWVLRSALNYIKCFHTEAGKIDPPEFYERAAAYRPSIIVGEPSWLLRLSETAESRGVWPVKFLLAGGENITEAARSAIQRVWNAPLYLNYGQTEAFGGLGLECVRQEGYHRNDFNFFFEVIDADRDGYGELVYTTLTRDCMPLIRYRSTDVTRFVETPCGCGLFTKRLGKVRARCDEMIVCGMGNIGPWIFAELLRDAPGVGEDWQVFVRHEGKRDVVELRVELDDPSRQAEIERLVHAHLRERFPDFWKNREMKLYDLCLVGEPRGSLRTSRKLRRIVDERQMLMRRAS